MGLACSTSVPIEPLLPPRGAGEKEVSLVRRSLPVLVVLGVLLGCGGKDSPTEPVLPTPTPIATATPPPTPTPPPTATATPTPPAALASLAGIVTSVSTTSPIAGAVITCQSQSATTGADGRYAFAGLAVGGATVTALRSGYDPYAQTISLAAGANLLNIGLSQSTSGTSVSGTVTGSYIDGSTRSLSGALVTIAGKTDTTDASGHFQLPTIPEGNQLVSVTLAGWAPYSQTFFLSSTSRTLALGLTYNGPDLRAITPEWVFDTNCTTSHDHPHEVGFILYLRKFLGTLRAADDFTLSVAYTPQVLTNGHPPSLTDPVRMGRPPGNYVSCSDALQSCSNLPASPTLSGGVGGARAGTYANFSPGDYALSGTGTFYTGSLAAPDTVKSRVYIAHWATNPADTIHPHAPACPDITYQTDDIRVQYTVTVVFSYTHNQNQWTTTSRQYVTPTFLIP